LRSRQDSLISSDGLARHAAAYAISIKRYEKAL
jgi:hypothetical protein